MPLTQHRASANRLQLTSPQEGRLTAPRKVRARRECLLWPLLSHTDLGSRQHNEAAKRNQKHLDWKGRNEPALIHAQRDYIESPMDSKKTLLGLINKNP